MPYYHASAHPLFYQNLKPDKLLFVSDNKEFVRNEFGLTKPSFILYEVELYKSKVKLFDILKPKHFKIWLSYLYDLYRDKAMEMFNMTIRNGKLSWYLEDEVFPILKANKFNCCIFDEAGADISGSDWSQYISGKYGDVSSIAITDPSIIKSIKPIYEHL